MAIFLLWRFLPYIFPIYAINLTQEDQSVELVSRQRLSLGTLLTQSQEQTAVVSLPQVSSHFIHAIIAAEDGQYYHHGALDELWWRQFAPVSLSLGLLQLQCN